MATRELYDLDTFKTKALAAIARLKSQPPSAKKGKVGKVDVLNEVRTEILELVDAGYTITNIRAAFETDVFKILPKTLTEIIKEARKEAEPKLAGSAATVAKKPRKTKVTKVTTVAPAAAKKVDKSTFSIDDDEQV